jgi:hypothetical protein
LKKRGGAHIEVEVRLKTEMYASFPREMEELQTLEGLGTGAWGLFQQAGACWEIASDGGIVGGILSTGGAAMRHEEVMGTGFKSR